MWLSSRWALNAYFWLFLFVAKCSDADDQTGYPFWIYVLVILFLMVFFAGIAYINNLVLQPLLLFKRHHVIYLLCVLLMITVAAFGYTYLLKVIPLWLPGMDVLAMSIVMDPVSSDSTLAGIVADMQTYFSMMLIWVILFGLLGLYHHNQQKVKLMQLTIAKHQEAELHFLKNQLNPHFLFNTLNNLYALTLKKSDEAPEAILKLAAVLRYMLYEADVKLISFEQEKEVIQAYIDIELLRLKKDNQVQFSVVADANYHLPPLLWLPVLENVFKYTRNQPQPSIDFNLQLVSGSFKLNCRNSYVRNIHTSLHQKGGIGLSNLTKRLELLYPGKHKITQQLNEKEYSIEVTIDSITI